MRTMKRFILAGAFLSLVLSSGCPRRNTFTVRIVNDAHDAAITTLKLDNRATQGTDSGDFLTESIGFGDSRNVRIDVGDAEAAGADGVLVAGVRTDTQSDRITQATVPVAFVAGESITITMVRQDNQLSFEFEP